MAISSDRRASERKLVSETLVNIECGLKEFSKKGGNLADLRTSNTYAGDGEMHPSPQQHNSSAAAAAAHAALYYSPVYKGVAAAVGTFGFLRYGPVLAMRLSARFMSGGGKSNTRPSRGSIFAATSTARQDSRNWWKWLAVDGLLSLFGGFVMMEREKAKGYLRNTISQLLVPETPLQPGFSLYSDFYCPIVASSLQERRDLPAMNGRTRALLGCTNGVLLQDPQTEELKALVLFYRSCRRRHAYQQQLRSELGLGETDPVEIPKQGVPSDFIFSAEDNSL